MSIALGIWHLVLEGGKEKYIETPASIQITNASYGETVADQKSRDVVKLSFESLTDDEEDEEEEKEQQEDEESDDGIKVATTVLCALTPGKIEQASINLVLDREASFKFENVGKNTIYLTGNYIRQEDDDAPDSDDEDDFSDEDAYDLREVSSDVEMHGDDLEDLESDNSRFEEIEDEEPAKETTKPAKRARESDAADADKKKKLKAETGKAAEAPKEEKKDKKEKKEKKPEAKKEEKKVEEKAEEKKTPKKKTLAGGLVVEDAKVGTGPMAKKGNTVRMRYVGKLTNGKEFDKNVKGKPFTFHLGKGEVIKGWDEGIVGMQVGGERKLVIPPALGYGSRPSGPIPANSTLIFEVKLLEIK